MWALKNLESSFKMLLNRNIFGSEVIWKKSVIVSVTGIANLLPLDISAIQFR